MTVQSIMDDEIVTVPVPKRLLLVVIKAMAEAMEPEGTSLTETVEATVAEPTAMAKGVEAAPIDWTDAGNMKRLRKGLNSKVAVKLLDMTAARPGVKVPFEEIYKAAGYTETRRAGSSLGSLTKVIKRNFGLTYEKSVWPVEHHWAANDDAQYSYLMLPDVAAAWRQTAA